MPLQGTLLADFDSFTNAVAQAQTSLAGFETGASKVESALTRMTTTMEGGRIVQQATLAAQAIEDIGGVTKLTTAELEKWSSVATEAAAKLTAMGEDVPPKIQALADATTNVHGAWSAFVQDFNITDAIEHPLTAATDGMSALAASMGPAAAAALGVVSAVGAIGAALFEVTTRAAEGGERIQDFSTKTGMSVPAVSMLSKALNVAGGDLDTVGNAMFLLEKNMGDMTPKFQDGMARLKISSDDFKEAGTDGYLALIAQRLEETADPIQKTTALADLFGRSGRDLAPILDKLAESLQLTSSYTPWTAEQARDAEAFEMEMRALTLSVQSFVVSIGKEFIEPAKLFLDAINASKGGVSDFADMLSGGMLTGIGVAREALRGATDIAETFEKKIQDVRAALGDLPAPIDASATAFGRWADYVLHFSWAQFTKDAIQNTAAAVHVLTGEMENLPEVGGPALARLTDSTAKATAQLDAMQMTGKSVTMSVNEQAAAIRELDAPVQKSIDAANKYADAWTVLNSMGSSYADTVAQINPKIAEQAEYYLKAGATIAQVAAAFPELSAAQAKALDEMVKQYDATYKAIQKIEDDHAQKQKTNMFGLSQAENEQSQIRIADEGKAATQLIAIDKKLNDDRMQQTMDRATFEDLKLWESAEKQIEAYKATGATAQQVTQFSNALYEDTQIQAEKLAWTATETVVNITQQGIDAMTNMVKNHEREIADMARVDLEVAKQVADSYKQIYSMGGTGKDQGLGMGTDSYGNKYYLQPGQTQFGSTAGGVNSASGLGQVTFRASGGPVTLGSSYIVGENGPELYTPGASGFITPNRMSGGSGGGGMSITINVTQPFGTPEAIARAVADAQVGLMRSQGIRLPYGS